MFRLKITLTHAVLVCLLIGAAHLFVSTGVRTSINENAELSLRRAAFIAEQTKRLDHYALQEKGEMVAADPETYKYLTLEREKLLQKIENEGLNLFGKKMQKKLGGKGTPEAEKAAEKGGANLSTADLRHLAVDYQLRVAKHRFLDIAKEQPSGERRINRSLLARPAGKQDDAKKQAPRVQPDLVAVVNQSGKAVAALGPDRYSWGASSNSPNLASKYSSVQGVLDNPPRSPKLDVWSWKWSSGDDATLYQVAVVPIPPRDGGAVKNSPAGAVIVGYTITDGAAENIQSLVGGVTKKKQEQAGHIEKEDLPDVAFFHGNSVHSSTFGPNIQQRLGKKLFEEMSILEEDKPEQVVHFALEKKPYIGFVRFLPEQFGAKTPTGVVVMANMAQARAPLESMLWKFDITAFIAILLGIALFLFFYQRFIKPVSEIEETIAEILSGNKEAEFVITDEEHPVFASVAQGLNLVSAFLQGKPMPDEEAELEGWGDLVGPGDDGGGGGGGAGGGSPDVQGVQMPGMGGGDDGDDGES